MKTSDRSRYPEVFVIKFVLKIFLFFFYTIDLQKDNNNTKKFTKLTYNRDQIGETKKVKNKQTSKTKSIYMYIFIHK